MDLGFDFVRKQDTFQVASAAGNTVAFAKLILYPQYQVQGLLPREIISANMDSPIRFGVRFQNPDLSHYHLNGRSFSFTLTFTNPLGTH